MKNAVILLVAAVMVVGCKKVPNHHQNSSDTNSQSSCSIRSSTDCSISSDQGTFQHFVTNDPDIWTDAKTGCQYLVGSDLMSYSPRLDSTGKPMCSGNATE